MTDEEAIEILDILSAEYYPNAPEKEALDMAIKALEQQQDVHDTCKKCIEFSEFEKLLRWIPASKELPKENEYIGNVCKYYLIQDEYGDMHVAHLSNVGWIPMESLKAIGSEVVAWMPLPEPYNAESEESE